jgi:structural maintenance of chromosome 1
MDAISFVLGIKSAQLRSSQLKDLVYRGRRLANNGVEEASGAAEEEEDEDEEGEGEGTAKKAWVLAVYEDDKHKEWRFQRTSVAFPSPFPSNVLKTRLIYSEYPQLGLPSTE